MVPDGNWPTTTEIASRQVAYEPEPFAGVSPDLWRVISKAIQKSPCQRYQLAIELLQALHKAEPRRREVVEQPLLQPATENTLRTRCRALAKRLLLPIGAGSVFGAAAAGSLHGSRTSEPLVSPAFVPGVTPPQLSAVSERLMAPVLLNAPARMLALGGSSTTPTPSQPSKTTAAVQPAMSAARARPTDNGSESPIPFPAAARHADLLQSNEAAAVPLIRTKGQERTAGKSLGD